MTLRCKPHQLAVIDIPPEDAVPELREQFNGLPVTTCCLVGDGSDFWVISPKLSGVMRNPCIDDRGVEAPSGPVRFGSVWDRWLRPIGSDSVAPSITCSAAAGHGSGIGPAAQGRPAC